ncbi:MAG: diguanylate cyclase (GGDEF)-like protein/PAS domain S-box-containing protein [Rhodoferax sp.]|jgi:diguanylate cyclase (GGDEF)-like protein/PAS domain S-box-containing protein
MFTKFSRLPIRTQLVLLVLIVLLPVFAVFIGGLVQERQAARQAAYAQLRIQVDTTAASLTAFFTNHEAVLGHMAERPQVRRLDAGNCDPLLKDYVSLHPEFVTLSVRDLAGLNICAVTPTSISQARLLTFPWFQQALTSSDFKVSDSFVGPASGRWVAVMSQPVLDANGEKSGLVMLPADLLRLNNQLLESVPRGVLVTVTDGARKMVLRSSALEKWAGQAVPAGILMNSQGQTYGEAEGLGSDGVSRLYAFVELPGIGWRVAAGVPESVAFAASDGAFRNGLLIGLGILFMALALAWRIGLGLVRPIESLAATVRQLLDGDGLARTPQVAGSVEIESVAQAFNRMLDQRTLDEAALIHSEENLTITLQSIGDAVMATDAEGRITRMNPAAERLTGWLLADAAGRRLPEVFCIVNAHTRQLMTDPVLRVMANGAPVGLPNHTLLLARDGAEHQISDSAAPIRDVTGQVVGVVLVFSDVSEQYRVQEALRVREQRLRILLARSSAVIRTMQASGDFGMTFVSDSVRELLGYEPAELVDDSGFWSAHIHPEDAAPVWANLDLLFDHDQAFYEYRLRHRDGSYRWLLDDIRLFRDAQGEPTELIGVWVDTTERKLADAALKENQTRYQALIELSPFGIAVHRHGRLIYVNPAAARMLGAYLATELLDKPILDLVHPDDRAAVTQRINDTLERGMDVPMREQKFLRLDGSVIDVQTQNTAISYNGTPAVQVSFQDITARRQLEIQSEGERNLLEQLARGEPLTVILMNLARNFEHIWPGVHCSVLLLDPVKGCLKHGAAPSLAPAYCEAIDGLMIGSSQGSCGTAAFTGKPTLVADIASDPLWIDFRELALSHGLRACWSVPILAVAGQVLGTFAFYFSTPREALAKELAAIQRGADLASLAIERDQVAAQIHQLAFYDALTSLPNRQLLRERLKSALLASGRHHGRGALLFIDLDNFKILNDTRGHDVGDLLLQQVALRLSACVRDTDTVARLGGDEFVVMLENLSDDVASAALQAEEIGQKILSAFRLAFTLRLHDHLSTPSIGIALFGGQVSGVDELLKQADLAMYQAKAGGRNTLRFFDTGMQTAVQERAALEDDLRNGLERQEMLLHYQPVVQADGIVTGAEALVRWQQPQRGLVPPGAFIGLAEATGLILPLGHWVLQTACRQLVAWARQPGMAHLSLAVNVSASQFRERHFVAQVQEVLLQTGANPRRLKLELTESLLAENVEDVIEKMTALRLLGVNFSLDDFGTGYSSLSYLKRLPLSQLKIDQSFVRDVLTDPNDAAIARTIVLLGQSLGLAVIAEGVETEGQRQFLADIGCIAYQGYLFSRPLPIEQFEAFVRRDT